MPKPGVFRLDITSTLLSGFSCWSFYRPPKFIRFWTGLWSSKLQLQPNPIGLTDLNIIVKHLWLFAVISILTDIMSERVEQLTQQLRHLFTFLLQLVCLWHLFLSSHTCNVCLLACAAHSFPASSFILSQMLIDNLFKWLFCFSLVSNASPLS